METTKFDMKNRKGFGKLIQFALIGLIVLSLTFITAPAIISFYDVALDASAGTSTSSSTLSSVDTEAEWADGTLTGLNNSGGVLKLDHEQIQGEYVSPVNNVSGSLNKVSIDSTVYNSSSSSADLVVETSDTFSFSSVQDTLIVSLSNSTTTADLSSLSGDFVRLKINMTRQVNGG